MAGINETKEVLSFVLSLCNALGKSLEDGKFSYFDAYHFFGAASKALPAIQKIGDVPLEIKDLSQMEKEELIRFIEKEFDIPQDAIEGYVEKGLAAVINLSELILSFKK